MKATPMLSPFFRLSLVNQQLQLTHILTVLTVSSVQALETMTKLNEIKGYIRNTLDKLPGIRAGLVRLDDSWQDWRLCELAEALRNGLREIQN